MRDSQTGLLSGKKNDFYRMYDMGFPCGSDGKESAFKAGDPGSVPKWGRSPGGGNGNPLQHSCLENSMGRGARGRRESGMTEQLTYIIWA